MDCFEALQVKTKRTFMKKLILFIIVAFIAANSMSAISAKSMLIDGIIFEVTGAIATGLMIGANTIINKDQIDQKKLGLVFFTPLGGATVYGLRCLNSNCLQDNLLLGIVMSCVSGTVAQKIFNDTKIKDSAGGSKTKTITDHLVFGSFLGLSISALALLTTKLLTACNWSKIMQSVAKSGFAAGVAVNAGSM